MTSGRLCIHYHRDFDGVVSAAVLAKALRERCGEDPQWQSVNYDQRDDWRSFQAGRRFAIVDFHFHPRAEWWFDHHPTTFLDDELREMIVANAPIRQIKDAARKRGTRLLREAAMDLVRLGETTLQEINRVTFVS